MPFLTTQLPDGPLVEGSRGTVGLVADSAGTELLEACFGANAERALLHAENLPPGFFDLSSRQAGELLQRLRLYGIRLAVLLPAEGVAMSSRFGEMLAEEQQGKLFGVFRDRAEAILWLTAPEGAA